MLESLPDPIYYTQFSQECNRLILKNGLQCDYEARFAIERTTLRFLNIMLTL